MKKTLAVLLNALPVLLMIGLIPVVVNDYVLTLIYVLLIIVSLFIRNTKNDLLFLFFGFFIMLVFESIFIATGVETFNRNTLFGLMPLWLPFLWAYGFVAIKRSIVILEK